VIAFEARDLQLLGPQIAVLFFALLVLLHDVLVARPSRIVSVGATALGLVVALVLNTWIGLGLEGPMSAFSGMAAVDGYAVFFNTVIILAGLGALLIGHDYLERLRVVVPEYNPMVLFAVFAMMLMSTGNDLIVLFIAIESMSIALYAMCGMNRGDGEAVEAAIKYFVLGAFASAILLYGIAFVYGEVGSTQLVAIGEWFTAGNTVSGAPLMAIGLGLVLVGFGFKVAAAPFHMWSPDVYQGAPTSVTAFMATGVKVASFAAMGRVVFVAFGDAVGDWTHVMWVLAAASILVGNLAALAQSDLKRMLAYSSVGHAGYVLMAFVGMPEGGIDHNPRMAGMLFYLMAYTLMNLGAFAAVSLLARDGEEDTSIDRLSGLAARHPLVAAGLAVCLFSLAGIPPTMGFVGKFYLFAAAVEGGQIALAVVGALGGAAGVFYYLRPIVAMYMRPGREDAPIAVNLPASATLLVATVGVLVLGVIPGPVIDWCRASLHSLVGWGT
jgi:NADH-quinone oxidoreductase subunit N